MFRKICLILFLFFSLSTLLFARGRGDEAEDITHNNEWLLCIADFDVSGLAIERRDVSRVIMRQLVEILSSINYRARISSEYAYYEESSWSASRSEAAKALSAKQEERSLLLFSGEPDRRYRAAIANFDAEIEKLRASLEEIDNNAPLVNQEPVFMLAAQNMDFQFPEAPAGGNEYRFCLSQKADAVLIGSISDYHGRFLVSIKLYALYSRSFIWEDRIVFSHGDLDAAVEEITRRLLILLSGNRPGAVAINTEPEEALVLINRSFAGRGETEIMEFPPGIITVTASAPDHESITFETELESGQLSQISISLKPIEYGEFEIAGNHKGFSGSVYNGAMYVGESPLTLRLPLNYMEYLEIETADGDTGRIIYRTPGTAESPDAINIRTARPPREGRVDRARRMFYWSFGGTWITGIAAWISYYSYINMARAYNQGAAPNPGLYNDARRMNNIYRGTVIAAGVLGLIDIILLIRYVYLANRGSTQVRTGRN